MKNIIQETAGRIKGKCYARPGFVKADQLAAEIARELPREILREKGLNAVVAVISYLELSDFDARCAIEQAGLIKMGDLLRELPKELVQKELFA